MAVVLAGHGHYQTNPRSLHARFEPGHIAFKQYKQTATVHLTYYPATTRNNPPVQRAAHSMDGLFATARVRWSPCFVFALLWRRHTTFYRNFLVRMTARSTTTTHRMRPTSRPFFVTAAIASSTRLIMFAFLFVLSSSGIKSAFVSSFTFSSSSSSDELRPLYMLIS